jgi:hypothetical protein
MASVYDIFEAPFALFDRTPTPEDTAVGMQRSTHQQPTAVSQRFFGRQNVDLLQRRLRDEVRKRTGYEIDRQSDEQLLIVMRYVFMQSGRNAGGEAEVRRLNELVLRETVPQVGSGLAQYLGYLRDASTLPTPIPRGQATSVKGTKITDELFPRL